MIFDEYEKQLKEGYANSTAKFSDAITDKGIFENIGEITGISSKQYFIEDAQYAELIVENKYHDINRKIIKEKMPEYEQYYNRVASMTAEEKTIYDNAIKTGNLNEAFSLQDKGKMIISKATGKPMQYDSLENMVAYKKIKEIEQQHDLKLYTQDEVRKAAVRDVNNQRSINDVRRKQQSSTVGDFAGGMAAMLDPLNAATMFIPVGGQYAAGVKHMQNVLATGGKLAKTKEGYAALDLAGNVVEKKFKGFTKSSLAVGVKSGLLGAAAETYNQYNHVMPYRTNYLKDNYTTYDAFTNIGFAAGGGALLGSLFEGFSQIRNLRRETDFKKDFIEFEDLLKKSVEYKQTMKLTNPEFRAKFNEVSDILTQNGKINVNSQEIMAKTEELLMQEKMIGDEFNFTDNQKSLSKNDEILLEMQEVHPAVKQLYDNDIAIDDIATNKNLTIEGTNIVRDEILNEHNEALANAVLQYNALGEVKVGKFLPETRKQFFNDKIDELTQEGNIFDLDEKVYNFLKENKDEIKQNMQVADIDQLRDDIDFFFETETRAKEILGEDKYNNTIMNDKELEQYVNNYKLENPEAASFEVKRAIAEYINDLIELEQFKNAEVRELPVVDLSIHSKKINNELKKEEILTDEDIMDIFSNAALIDKIKNKNIDENIVLTEEEQLFKDLVDEFPEEFDFVDDFGIIVDENKALDDLLSCGI